MNIPARGSQPAAIVPVVSAWASKINWAALISMAATILAIWNIMIPAEVQVNLVAGILALCVVIDGLIVLFRTFFTKSVTPAAVADAPLVDQQKTVAAVTPPGPVVSVVEDKSLTE